MSLGLDCYATADPAGACASHSSAYGCGDRPALQCLSPRLFHHNVQPSVCELNDPLALDIGVVCTIGLDEPKIDDCEPVIAGVVVIAVVGCVAVITVTGLDEVTVNGCEADIVVIAVVGCVAIIAVIGLDELVVDGWELDIIAIAVVGCVAVIAVIGLDDPLVEDCEPDIAADVALVTSDRSRLTIDLSTDWILGFGPNPAIREFNCPAISLITPGVGVGVVVFGWLPGVDWAD